MEYVVSFKSGHAPIRVDPSAALQDVLTAANSPVLFGCRTGICGTCASRVESPSGSLPAASDDERETLKLFCPSEPAARLLCQLKPCADIRVEPLHP
ncbi:MAG: (2Fe-2S)-binding protein [Elusimicrobia bacterium]|nr:(2Fe-2S)-binding protein [Elusimicrobiota bacterium]